MGITRSISNRSPPGVSRRRSTELRPASRHGEFAAGRISPKPARSKEALIPANVSELQLNLEGRISLFGSPKTAGDCFYPSHLGGSFARDSGRGFSPR